MFVSYTVQHRTNLISSCYPPDSHYYSDVGDGYSAMCRYNTDCFITFLMWVIAVFFLYVNGFACFSVGDNLRFCGSGILVQMPVLLCSEQ